MVKTLNGVNPDRPVLSTNSAVGSDSNGFLVAIDSTSTGDVLTSNGTSPPTFQTPTGGGGLTGGNAGEMPFQTAPSTTTFTNSAAGILETDGTTPAFTTTPNIRAATGTSLATTGNISSSAGDVLVTNSTGIVRAGTASDYARLVGDTGVEVNFTTGGGNVYSAVTGDATELYAGFQNTTNTVTVGIDGSTYQAGAAFIETDGSDVIMAPNQVEQLRIKAGGVVQATNYTSADALGTDGSGNLQAVSLASTGTGNLVRETSPTIITPTITDTATVSGTGTVELIADTSNAASVAAATFKQPTLQGRVGLAGGAPFGAGNLAVEAPSGQDIVFADGAAENARITSTGVVQLQNYISSDALGTDGSGNLTALSATGTGDLVKENSPTIVTPTVTDLVTVSGTGQTSVDIVSSTASLSGFDITNTNGNCRMVLAASGVALVETVSNTQMEFRQNLNTKLRMRLAGISTQMYDGISLITGNFETLAGNITAATTSTVEVITDTSSTTSVSGLTMKQNSGGTQARVALAGGAPFGAGNLAIEAPSGKEIIFAVAATEVMAMASTGFDQVKIDSAITTKTGSVTGTVDCSQPFQGTTYKKVLLFADNSYSHSGTVTYTYPTAFTNTPEIISDAGSIVSSVSTTQVTINATASDGFATLEGY